MNGSETDAEGRKHSLLRRMQRSNRPLMLTVIASPTPSLPGSRCNSSLKSRSLLNTRGGNRDHRVYHAQYTGNKSGKQTQTEELAFILRETLRLRNKQAEMMYTKDQNWEGNARLPQVKSRRQERRRCRHCPEHQRSSTALSSPIHRDYPKPVPFQVRIQLPQLPFLVSDS